jgi:ribosomal subunit interface protein
MRYTLYTQNIVLSPFSRRQLEEKVQRIEKFLRHPLPLEVAIKQEGRAGAFVCALTYGEGKHVLHAERSGDTFEDSLDAALLALRHELIKQRDRQRVRA